MNASTNSILAQIIAFVLNAYTPKEICSNLLVCVNLGLLALSFVVDKAK